MKPRRERRSHPRRRAEERVRVTVLSAEKAPHLERRRFTCSTQDLSVGGLRFRSQRLIPLGALITLHIAAPHPLREFDMKARVVWLIEGRQGERHAVGARFTDVPKSRFNAWRRMLEEKTLRQDAPRIPHV